MIFNIKNFIVFFILTNRKIKRCEIFATLLVFRTHRSPSPSFQVLWPWGSRLPLRWPSRPWTWPLGGTGMGEGTGRRQRRRARTCGTLEKFLGDLFHLTSSTTFWHTLSTRAGEKERERERERERKERDWLNTPQLVPPFRYAGVFWGTNKALGLVFFTQLILNAAQSIFSINGFQVSVNTGRGEARKKVYRW